MSAPPSQSASTVASARRQRPTFSPAARPPSASSAVAEGGCSVVTVSERRKGLRGQQEVQRILRDAGFVLRRVSHKGDALVDLRNGRRLHIETKRQERLQLKEWLRQAADEAPRGATPVVCFRQSRGEWHACLPLADLLRLISG